MVWDGVYDDIYWTWNFTGGCGIITPAPMLELAAKTLVSLPALVRRFCQGCWYLEWQFLQPMPHIPQWDAYRKPHGHCPPCIYWKHPYEWDNNPPGFYYPWQTPPP
jgi:hypothetical protein